MSCPLCPPFETLEEYTLLLSRDHGSLLYRDTEPLEGSCMIVPHRHIESPFDLNDSEQQDFFMLLAEARAFILERHEADGFTLGWNVGEAAGQHLFHCHFHIVPRFRDEPYAGRGIRSWIKSSANCRTTVPIDILKYQESWNEKFLKLSQILSEAIQPLIISIDHIGSTSIPGLAAKDRIDVQISVASLDPHVQHALDVELTAAGFQATRKSRDHSPAATSASHHEWEKLFVSGIHHDLDFHANIHIREYGKANQRYPLLFRDFLRQHESYAKTYEASKRALASVLRYERDIYCDLKDPVCDLIMLAAEQWAEAKGWRVEDAMSTLHR